MQENPQIHPLIFCYFCLGHSLLKTEEKKKKELYKYLDFLIKIPHHGFETVAKAWILTDQKKLRKKRLRIIVLKFSEGRTEFTKVNTEISIILSRH